jgi:hypothetical protein
MTMRYVHYKIAGSSPRQELNSLEVKFRLVSVGLKQFCLVGVGLKQNTECGLVNDLA